MQDEQPLDERTSITMSLVESLGVRALGTANSFAAAIRLAPALAVKKALVEYVWEELRRFESASDLYAELAPGADLHETVRERLAEVPAPESWLEVTVVQFLYDRAGAVQMRELAESSDARLAKLAGKILEGERMHAFLGSEGGIALRNMLLGDPDRAPAAQKYVDRWLARSLRSFGRPGTPRSRRAIELGLRRRDAAEVVRDYIADLEPTIKRCGLRLPSREIMGLELPPGLGLA